uniref:L-ascorbate oxidase n=1 Tax=Aegilops tauschii TaxID=37682 RepID=M8BB09_AEGTA
MLPSARPLLPPAAAGLCLSLLVAVAEAKLAVPFPGEAPGPTIRATLGDTIVVDVHNKLETENTAIHWHGIRQIGTPWADGVAGVTQCPILPGETFTYKFVVDRPGTYLYHAHYGMQRVAGLNGMIVVTVPEGFVEPFSYDEEHTVLLGDWWHKSVYEQATGLSSNPFVFVTEPHSLLINGRGMFNCSLAPSGTAIFAHPHFVEPMPARADRTLLFLNTQNRIDGHIKWTINGVSLMFPATPYLVAMKRGMKDAYEQRPPPDMYDHMSHDISAPAPTNGTVGSPVYRLALGSVVDVVLQNSNMLNNKSETHPWHLHGHDFWVLGYGEGKFNPAADAWRLLNVRDPIMKNTVPLHPDGWTAVRFRADNPGVWLFHCHVEAHVFMGMGVVFEEGVERVGRLPSSIMGCGRSKGLH